MDQDRPGVIANARDQLSKMPPKEAAAYSRVEFEAYDLFTPQPRTDADAFLLRRCLHNNSDSDCIRILKAVVPGLANSGPDTRLLIYEKLMPEWNASSVRHKSKLLRRDDILAMITVGGKERSLKEFEGLVKAADERFEVCVPFPVHSQCPMLIRIMETARSSVLREEQLRCRVGQAWSASHRCGPQQWSRSR